MADTLGKIAVLVADGNYSALRELGFPLPALAAMQEAGVQLGQACWDVKQSTSGISVSFFWPITRNGCTHNKELVYKIYKFYNRTLSIVCMTTRRKIVFFFPSFASIYS